MYVGHVLLKKYLLSTYFFVKQMKHRLYKTHVGTYILSILVGNLLVYFINKAKLSGKFITF